MRIDITDEPWTEFENIKMGECFMPRNDQAFYIRTYSNTNTALNAVRLRDGYMTHVNPDTVVAPKNLVCKVEG